MSEYSADMMELLSAEPETEPHIVIAEDRTVIVPDELKEIAAQFDHNVETVTFDCPRYWDEHDFSTMHIFVNYRCADGSVDSFPCDPPTVDEADDTIIHFKWTISRNATCAMGTISFLVCVKRADADGVLQNQWSSRLNQEMEILEGFECNSEEIVSQNPDAIERILLRLDNIEKNGVTPDLVNDAVVNYLEEHPVTVQLMDENTVGGAKLGDNLKMSADGHLSVDTANDFNGDNTRPITAAAVETTVGNIEILLGTI